MDKKIYVSILASLATAAAVWLLALLLKPFLKPLAWALVIGIATIPHHERLAARFPNHPNRSAGVMVVIITMCIILPLAALVVMIAENTDAWYSGSEQLVTAFTRTLPGAISNMQVGGDSAVTLSEKFGVDIAGYAAKFASAVSQFLLDAATNAAKNFAALLFNLAMTLFILFFIYREGTDVVSAGINRFAANKERALSYLYEIRSATTAVMVGTILTCLVQGILAGLGYFVAGVPAPALCGALTAVTALVPVVGTAIVWLPLTVLLAVKGAYLKAGLLALWCLFFVGLADNAIRPLVIGAKRNIPIPAIVIGAIGGVASMGIIGLIIGPLALAIIAAVWREITETTDSEVESDCREAAPE